MFGRRKGRVWGVLRPAHCLWSSLLVAMREATSIWPLSLDVFIILMSLFFICRPWIVLLAVAALHFVSLIHLFLEVSLSILRVVVVFLSHEFCSDFILKCWGTRLSELSFLVGLGLSLRPSLPTVRCSTSLVDVLFPWFLECVICIILYYRYFRRCRHTAFVPLWLWCLWENLHTVEYLFRRQEQISLGPRESTRWCLSLLPPPSHGQNSLQEYVGLLRGQEQFSLGRAVSTFGGLQIQGPEQMADFVACSGPDSIGNEHAVVRIISNRPKWLPQWENWSIFAQISSNRSQSSIWNAYRKIAEPNWRYRCEKWKSIIFYWLVFGVVLDLYSV